MSDNLSSNTIVAALRRDAAQIPAGKLMRDAAAEIERLQQDNQRFISSHHVLKIENDTLKQKLVAAEQLAMRQGNEIRKLRGREPA